MSLSSTRQFVNELFSQASEADLTATVEGVPMPLDGMLYTQRELDNALYDYLAEQDYQEYLADTLDEDWVDWGYLNWLEKQQEAEDYENGYYDWILEQEAEAEYFHWLESLEVVP